MPAVDCYEGDEQVPIVIGLPGENLIGGTGFLIYYHHQRSNKRGSWVAEADTTGTPHKISVTTPPGTPMGPEGDMLFTARWVLASGRPRHSSDLQEGGRLMLRIGPSVR